MKTKYAVTSVAGDGINGVLFNSLDDAQSAVAHHYGDGTWEEVAGTAGPQNPAVDNAWEYYTEDAAESDSVARIDSVLAQ